MRSAERGQKKTEGDAKAEGGRKKTESHRSGWKKIKKVAGEDRRYWEEAEEGWRRAEKDRLRRRRTKKARGCRRKAEETFEGRRIPGMTDNRVHLKSVIFEVELWLLCGFVFRACVIESQKVGEIEGHLASRNFR